MREDHYGDLVGDPSDLILVLTYRLEALSQNANQSLYGKGVNPLETLKPLLDAYPDSCVQTSLALNFLCVDLLGMRRSGVHVSKMLKSHMKAKFHALMKSVGSFGLLSLADMASLIQLHYPDFLVVILNAQMEINHVFQGSSYVRSPLSYASHPLRNNAWGERVFYLQEIDQNHVVPFIRPAHELKNPYFWCYACHKVHNVQIPCDAIMALYKWCGRCWTPFATEEALSDHQSGVVDQCVVCNKGMSEACLALHKVTCDQRLAKHRVAQFTNRPCRSCHMSKGPGHKCVVSCAMLSDKISHHHQHWAFDMESRLEPIQGGGDYAKFLHVPNKVCAVQVFPRLDPAPRHSFDTMGDFLRFFLQLNVPVILWAHNLRGYDGRLLFGHLIQTLKTVPDRWVFRGSKIMSFKFKKLRFLDFNLHFSQSLDKSIAAFGLTSFEHKEFFPYRLNQLAHMDYDGPIPPIGWYDQDLMHESKRQRFLIWHAKQVADGIKFNLKRQLESYCMSDTLILAEAIWKYHSFMHQVTGFTPLTSVTVASFAKAVWTHRDYLPTLAERFPLYPLTQQEYMMTKKALKGGRTDFRQLLVELTPEQFDQGHRIRYKDVVSMYPYVMISTTLPYGKHRISTNQPPSLLTPQFLANFCGIIRCAIAPPRYTYMHSPVIVSHSPAGKLLSTLLPIVDTTITSIELKKAMEMGYTVGFIYEIHEYKGTKELFQSYIRDFIAKKQQAGREKNAGLKQVTKIMLNSLWGKFAERPNHANTEFGRFQTAEEKQTWLNSVLHSSSKRHIVEPHCLLRDGELEIWTGKTTDNDFSLNLSRSQSSVGCFVAAGGRLMLWEAMNQLGTRLIYNDTDSCMYTWKPGEWEMESSKELGGWEDEMGEEEFIVGVAAIAPKTYSLKILRRRRPSDTGPDARFFSLSLPVGDWVYEERTKAKGFTLNSISAENLNYESYREVALNQREVLRGHGMEFVWDQKRLTMTSMRRPKDMRFDDRDLKGDLIGGVIYPFGWEWTVRRLSNGCLVYPHNFPRALMHRALPDMQHDPFIAYETQCAMRLSQCELHE